MMPLAIRVRVAGERGSRVRLWVPVLPVVLVLSPILIVVALVLVGACIAFRANPLRALCATWRLFAALRGLRVELHQGPTHVLVNIS